MFRRLILFNAILLVLVIAGVLRLRHDMQAFSAEHRIDQIRPDSDKPLPKAISSAAATPKQEWPDIAAHDPFSFDRNDVAIVIAAQAAQQPKRPKPILFGTMKVGKNPLAMLAAGDSASRSSRPVYVGEVFDGWTVLEIQDKTVTVKSDEVKETLIVNDPTAQVARTYEKTGPSGPSPGPAVTPPSPAPQIAPAAVSDQQPTTPGTSGKKTCQQYTPFGMVTTDCK
jgi:hypothetical protein